MAMISRESRRNIGLFLAALLVAALANSLGGDHCPTAFLGSQLYCAILLAWALTVRRRIIHRRIRRCMIAVAYAFVLLFFLRVCRYLTPEGEQTLTRLLWYAYYLPLTAAPLLMLMGAKCIGKTDADRPLHRMGWLWLLWALLAAGLLTNDLHGRAFYADGPLLVNGRYSYGWLYNLTVLWQAALLGACLAVMLRRSAVSGCRRLAWVPLIPFAWTVVLLLLYVIAGGSPTVGGYKLYNVQEVYCIGYVSFWECCVQIGLIPVNTGYREIFERSGVHAALLRDDGTVAFRASIDAVPDAAQRRALRAGPVALGEHRWLCSAPVSGGTVCWVEDHQTIDRLNDALKEATARIEEESELISEENRIREEKARYATRNRLYDQIAYLTHGQLAQIETLLRPDDMDDAALRQRLRSCMVLGAYVKRRGNLAIVSEGAQTLAAGDLLLSIRESMEYLRELGAECSVHVSGAPEIPLHWALGCYDLFEAVAEAALPGLAAMLADLSASPDGLRMTLLLESPSALPDAQRLARAAAGGSVCTDSVDGDTRVRLFFGEAAP